MKISAPLTPSLSPISGLHVVEHFDIEQVLEGNQPRRKRSFKDKYGASVGR